METRHRIQGEARRDDEKIMGADSIIRPGSLPGAASVAAKNVPEVSRLSLVCLATTPLWQRERRCYWLSFPGRSEEHTSELQSRGHLVCRLLLEKKKMQ